MYPPTNCALWPNHPQDFFLDPRVMPLLRNRAAALSTESHWIAFRTDGQEFDRIHGSVVSEFLDSEAAD
jgi:hypothetical protein